MAGMMVICVINMLLAHSSYHFHFPLKFCTKCVCSWWYYVILTLYHAFAGLMVCISIVLFLLGCCHFTLLCLCHAYQSVLWVIVFFFWQTDS